MDLLNYFTRRSRIHSLEKYFTWIKQVSTRISSISLFAKTYTIIGETAPAWQDIRTLVDTAAKQASLGNIQVKNDLSAGIELFADPLIFKVFYNLIENAVPVWQEDYHHPVLC